MKTRIPHLNPEVKSYFLFFFLLFQLCFFTLSGQNDTLKVNLKGMGTGKSIVPFTDPDGSQTNDYFINLSFELQATNPKISTNNTQAIYDIKNQTGSIKSSCKIYDNILGTYFFDQSFKYQTIQPGILVYSIIHDSIEYIEFTLSKPIDQSGYPSKVVFYKDSVEVLYRFGWPLTSHHYKVPATVKEEGIFLEIIETDNSDFVKYVGFEYLKNRIQYFPISVDKQKKFAFINEFPTNNFGNELYLFDKNKKQIGHMYYEYNWQLNKDHVRNAILILHNDNDICFQDGETEFPYNNKYPGWDYYKKGEYPVSMLIPPLNRFPEKYDKPPIMLLHGLTGKYKYADGLADKSSEDVSYWFTTPGILNKKYPFHTWQMYYPDNDAVKTIAECLKFNLSHLKSLYSQKIRLVTHSYGGIITRQYLTEFSSEARLKVEKVLFLTPPFHGSFSANRVYENITLTGNIMELLKIADKEALCYRDVSLCSDVIQSLWNQPFPSLNGNSDVYDDYFVIAGSTSKNFPTESYHEEAKNHSDGVVSISSASLLDQNIGFATIRGNHDDGIHAQSKIHQANLIPDIINAYFTNNFDVFISQISEYEPIKAIVNHNKSVIKPNGMTLSNLKTTTIENYQMSLLNFEILYSNNYYPDGFYVFYNKSDKELIIVNKNLFTINPLIINSLEFGEFWKNQNTNRYYFHGNLINDNLLKLDNGICMDLEDGNYTITLIPYNLLGRISIPFKNSYCQSHFLQFDLSNLKYFRDNANGNTAIKNKYISPQSRKSASTDRVEIFVDNQASQVIFLLSSEQARKKSFQAFLLQPNGELFNKTIWQKDTIAGQYSVTIDNPAAGVWQIWPQDTTFVNDTLFYEVQALFQSKVVLYEQKINQVEINDTVKIATNLVVPEKNKLSDVIIKATVISPEGKKKEFDFSLNKAETDSGYVYSFTLNHDTSGVYNIAVECTGTYSNFKFERYFSIQVEVIDRTPILYIPDVTLDGLNLYKKIDLTNQVLCHDCNSDNFVFSYSILKNTDVSVTIDTASVAFITSSFKDTSVSIVEFVLKSNNQIVSRDTVRVYKTLPDIKLSNLQVSDTLLIAGKYISVSFDAANQSSTYTNNLSKTGIVFSKDQIYDKSDIVLTKVQLPVLSPNNSSRYTKNFKIPEGISFKYPYLLAVADIDSMIFETNKANNTVSRRINFTPQTIFQRKVTVNTASGELEYTEPNSLSGSTVTYNGYGVGTVSWWENNYIWRYVDGGTLPFWVNYQFNIDNYENLDSVRIQFQAHGTTSNGIYYSYLYLQVNNNVIVKDNGKLINASDWINYYIVLPGKYFLDGINQIKIGSSATSQTYVALREIMVELKYKQSIITDYSPFLNNGNKKNIVIYPNPVRDRLFFKGLDEPGNISVFDVTGKLALSAIIFDNQVDVSQLPKGFFIVRIETYDRIETEKFIKE